MELGDLLLREKSMDPTELLIEVLNCKVSQKVRDRIRSLVEEDKCVCCGDRKIFRDGNCTVCDRVVQSELSGMTKKERLIYMSGLYRKGLRLRPYEIRKYKRPVSVLRVNSA